MTKQAVKQDIISAYKPNGGLEERFHLEAGTENGVWDFVQTHLKQLPVWVANKGKMEIVAERQNYLLFDRMVAFHAARSDGALRPLNSKVFNSVFLKGMACISFQNKRSNMIENA